MPKALLDLLIVPLRPNKSRSLKCEGSYTPSSSSKSVCVSAQISRTDANHYQLRARRETSKPITILARFILTSVTNFWKPLRPAILLPDWP